MATLPNEVFVLVYGHLDSSTDVLSFRLVCRAFAEMAEPYIFSKLDIGFQEHNVERVRAQLQHTNLRRHVRMLAFNVCSMNGLGACRNEAADFDAWYSSNIHVPDCWDSLDPELPPDVFEEKLRELYPKDALFPVWKVWRRRFLQEIEEGYCDEVIDALQPVFNLCPRLDTLIIAERGYFHTTPEWPKNVEHRFNLENPHIRRFFLVDRLVQYHPRILSIVSVCNAQLRCLAITGLACDLFTDSGFAFVMTGIIPNLESLRLSIQIESPHSFDPVERALIVLAESLSNKLITLKLAFVIGTYAFWTLDLSNFLDSINISRLECFHLRGAYVPVTKAMEFIARHKSTLRDLFLADLGRFRGGSGSSASNPLSDDDWGRVLLWLRNAQLPLQRIYMAHDLTPFFKHSLLIEGTFRQMSDASIRLACGIPKEECEEKETHEEGDGEQQEEIYCILVQEDGSQITLQPWVESADGQWWIPPSPLTYDGDFFDSIWSDKRASMYTYRRGTQANMFD
ncbi:hypothetical protein K461DRAFT_279704 [Myriangium duriaei CBS 260.36]|uniref:F-box domain-containing protein n=1 Tax=Myriangium duriaei CBS 260.36 TaxID=1168546 RepID=A0A9P4IYQ2_9PEZI|nr:hypothetical protein K461DRAFT_279704 [Myriangium duriaei CBS 260.36]